VVDVIILGYMSACRKRRSVTASHADAAGAGSVYVTSSDAVIIAAFDPDGLTAEVAQHASDDLRVGAVVHYHGRAPASFERHPLDGQIGDTV
jgi:hypothetical protein